MYFTDTKELRDFEKMMQTVPGFDRDIQKDNITKDNNSNDERKNLFHNKLKRRK